MEEQKLAKQQKQKQKAEKEAATLAAKKNNKGDNQGSTITIASNGAKSVNSKQ